MPNNEEVTYLERLTANNEVIEEIDNVTELLPNSTTSQEQKLAELEALIKEKAGNDAIPIYALSDISVFDTGITDAWNVDYLEDFVIVSSLSSGYDAYTSPSTMDYKIYQIIDGQLILKNTSLNNSRKLYALALGISNNYLYYITFDTKSTSGDDSKAGYGYTKGFSLMKYNIETEDTTKVLDYLLPYNTTYPWASLLKVVEPFKIRWRGYLIGFDTDNEQFNIIAQVSNNSSDDHATIRNLEYSTFNDGHTTGSYLKSFYTGTKLFLKPANSITFVNKNSTKFIYSGNMYVLNSGTTQGEMIAEGFGNSQFYYVAGDNYYIRNKSLVKFDEETNTFTEIMTFNVNSVSAGYEKVIIKDNTPVSTYQILMFNKDFKNIIGYKIKGKSYYLKDAFSGITSESILNNYIAYLKDGTEVQGTMPDNGALNYTPSTSQQSIPTGYTSGGTISAVDNTIDSNIQAENIKKDVTILGVTGNFEGGINTDNTDLEVEDLVKKAEAYSALSELYPLANITSMSNAFVNTTNLVTLPTIDTTNITDMSNMFNGCSNLANVTAFSMNNVTNAEGMFTGCTSLTSKSLLNIANILPLASNLTNTTIENLGLASNVFEDKALKILVNKGYTDALPAFNPTNYYNITIVT